VALCNKNWGQDDRGAKGVENETPKAMGMGFPHPSRLGSLGSVVSYPRGVWENGFG